MVAHPHDEPFETQKRVDPVVWEEVGRAQPIHDERKGVRVVNYPEGAVGVCGARREQ